jgi:hypothetical protein
VAKAVGALTISFELTIVAAQVATFNAIYNFAGGAARTNGGLTIDP